MRRALTLLVVGALLLASRARANPSQELARARGEYQSGEYQRVVDILTGQLYPRPLISDEEELKEAHRLLGVAHFYLDEREVAKREFVALLFIDPDYSLDPVLESPDVYAYFETVRSELTEKLESLRRQKQQEEAKRKAPSREVLVVREIRYSPPWLNWLPFGVGQFANGQPGKGKTFMLTEGVLGGLSLSLFTAQAIEFGFPRGRLPAPDKIDRVRAMQVAQIGTGGLFLVAYAWGVIDAYANQRPSIIEHRSETPIATGAMRLVPYLAPGAFGALATWEL